MLDKKLKILALYEIYNFKKIISEFIIRINDNHTRYQCNINIFFFRVRNTLFSCMRNVIDSCEGANEYMLLTGYDHASMEASIDLLCGDIDGMWTSLQHINFTLIFFTELSTKFFLNILLGQFFRFYIISLLTAIKMIKLCWYYHVGKCLASFPKFVDFPFFSLRRGPSLFPKSNRWRTEMSGQHVRQYGRPGGASNPTEPRYDGILLRVLQVSTFKFEI